MQTFIRHSDSSNDANVVLVAAACCHIFCPFSFAHPAFPTSSSTLHILGLLSLSIYATLPSILRLLL